ncbi:DAR GTPase 2, mitochondrial [Quillaja saponaria]|uniref:DAR GTPase 2, mitochondrial n=1 Tax=Quillaja saponaria TaxID=32244 RepID=A0AAD7M7A5_QUISA|nr:DAR GTPase 2, mitochondrial [Quillaja saponaria]
MATATLARRIGTAIKTAARNKGLTREGPWYTPHMAAASRAILERLPLVDLILEVRDARIPLSSAYEALRKYPSSSRKIIVLNKMDLANQAELKAWMKLFDQQNFISYGVNSHNKDNIKEFLNFIQARIRELKKTDHSRYTATVMLIGIPNVGKSALANSLHQVGRISAAEKGRLKHTTVSPEPCETKDISSLKIGSHPNIYILDTPGVLPPEIPDVDICSKLALTETWASHLPCLISKFMKQSNFGFFPFTGAVEECLVGRKKLAQYFLAILNSNNEYKKWEKLSIKENDGSSIDCKSECLSSLEVDRRQKRQYPADHTQDFVVNNVRRILFDIVSCFERNKENVEEMMNLIMAQFNALQDAFQVFTEFDKDAHEKVAAKLLNLYRTGRLGQYSLDVLPRHTQ